MSTTIPGRARRAFDLGVAANIGVALVVAGLTLVPVVYVILGGFRSTGQLASDPVALPSPWIFTNYSNVLTSSDFWGQVLNSTIVGAATTGLVVLLGVMAAFVLARYDFRGREAVYTFFTLGLLFPIGVAILPLYLMLREFGLLGNLMGVALPQVAFGLPLTIVILRPFLRAIPAELEDAAVVDGASYWQIYSRVILPLSGPALSALAIFTFLAQWNSFLYPLVVTNSTEMSTLTVGLRTLQGQYNTAWTLLMAGSVIALVPVLLVFIFAQRYFIKGIAMTGLGGR